MDKSCVFKKIVLLAALFLLIWSSAACRSKVNEAELKLRKFADLAGAGVRVGIVDPELGPAGLYARQVLEKMRPVEAVTATAIEKNIVTYESHVRALLNKVLGHEIDAGFVYRSDTLKVKNEITIIEIPAPYLVSPQYVLARMKGTTAPVVALDFITWFLAPERRGLWQEYGFRPFSSSTKTDTPVTIVSGGHRDFSRGNQNIPLTIFAAAVFYDVLPQLAKEYRKESGVELECEFAGSGKLYHKLLQGAVGVCGADIFLSATPFYVAELERQCRADCVRTFMGNDLVVAVFRP